MNGHKQQKYKEIKRKFPELLLANRGFINITCKKLNIHRNTYYLWYKEDPKFAEACDEVIENVGDWVESKLFENIANNDITAIKFCLSTKFKHRGYAEKEQNVINVNSSFSDDDFEMLDSYIERRIQERLKKAFE